MNFTVKLHYASLTEFLARQVRDSRGLDLARGGMFVRTQKPMPIGTEVSFSIDLKDGLRVIEGQGVVRWSAAPGSDDAWRRGPGMGIEFATLSEESRALLDVIVAARERLAGGGVATGSPAAALPGTSPKSDSIPLPSANGVPLPAPSRPAAETVALPGRSAPRPETVAEPRPPPAFDIVDLVALPAPSAPPQPAVRAPTPSFSQLTASLQDRPSPPTYAQLQSLPTPAVPAPAKAAAPAAVSPPAPAVQPPAKQPAPAAVVSAPPPPTPAIPPSAKQPAPAVHAPARRPARGWGRIPLGVKLGIFVTAGLLGAFVVLGTSHHAIARAPLPPLPALAPVQALPPPPVAQVVKAAPPKEVPAAEDLVTPLQATSGGLKVGALRFQGLPDGAKVTVDSYGVPNPAAEQYLAAGSHAVAVEAKGFLPYAAQIDLAIGEIHTLSVELKPRPVEPHGTVEISCQPWCQIWVDGRDTGKTSPAKLSLIAGTHVLTLANPPAGLAKKLTVKVPESGDVRQMVRLDE